MRAWILLSALVPAFAAAPRTEEVVLRASDGTVLKGTFTRPEGKGRMGAVLLVHQFRSDRKGWEPLLAELHKRGLATLTMDVRGHGESLDRGGETVSVDEDFVASAKRVGFDRIPGDLVQASAWLRARKDIDGRRIGLAGSSVGGFSAILAAREVHPTAVLALSPAGSVAFGEGAQARLGAAAKAAACAFFVVASDQDADAAASLKAVEGAPGMCAQLLKGTDHGFAFFQAGRQDTMAVFFATYLRRRAHPSK